MAYEERDNSGTIFKNSYKKTDAQPDYTGKGMIGGVEGRFSMWIKEGQKGKFMSLAWTPNEEMAPRATTSVSSSSNKPVSKPKPVETDFDIDDDIPFK